MLAIRYFYESSCYYIFSIKGTIFNVMLTIRYCSIRLLLHFCDKEINFQCHVDLSIILSIQLLLHFCKKRTNFHLLFCSVKLLLHFCDKETCFQCQVAHPLFCSMPQLLHLRNKETNFKCYNDHFSLFFNLAFNIFL